MHQLEMTSKARRDFKQLPQQARESVVKKLKVLCLNPYATNLDVKKLAGKTGYRLRIGRYRIIYKIDQGRLIILVIAIGHRKDIYQ